MVMIAEGSTEGELDAIINGLPPGKYIVHAFFDDGQAYEIDINCRPEPVEGVGYIMLILWAVAGLGALLVGWKIYSAVSKVPSWAWLIAAGVIVYMAYDKFFPKAKQAAYAKIGNYAPATYR